MFDVIANQPGKTRGIVALLWVVAVNVQRLLTTLHLLEQHHADIKVMVVHPHAGEMRAGALAITEHDNRLALRCQLPRSDHQREIVAQ